VVFLLGKLLSSTGLDGADRLAGLLFGAARGALIVAVLVLRLIWFLKQYANLV
jgi:membrane protein required for colicin V production